MRKGWMRYGVFLILFFTCFFISIDSEAQCSICTRTAEQLGEKPAKGLNAGIMYLAFTPLALFAIIGYQWYKRNKANEAE